MTNKEYALKRIYDILFEFTEEEVIDIIKDIAKKYDIITEEETF